VVGSRILLKLSLDLNSVRPYPSDTAVGSLKKGRECVSQHRLNSSVKALQSADKVEEKKEIIGNSAGFRAFWRPKLPSFSFWFSDGEGRRFGELI